MSAPPANGAAPAAYLEGLFGLAGRTAMVTGASRGLGAAMATALARAGANVCCVGRRDNLDRTVRGIEEAGGTARGIVGDLGTEEGLTAIVRAAEAHFGAVDILVNNAGTFVRKPALSWTREDWASVVDLSTTTVFGLCQLVAPGMIERGRGKIINIGSVLSFQGGHTVPGYAASRHAIVGLTRALANEWAPLGVNVNAIAPGYVDTDILDDLKRDPERSRALLSRVPVGRWGRPEELAGAVVYLASSASDFVHGATLIVDGGWSSR